MTRQAWYIFEDGKTHGPVTARELLYLVEMERLDPDALVWRPGFSEWKPAHEVEGIYKPPPLPHGGDPGAGRAPRVPPPDFVRVISPPLPPDDDVRADSLRSRSADRLHSPNSGRPDLNTLDLEATDESDIPLAGSVRVNDNSATPPPKAATLGVVRTQTAPGELPPEAPQPRVATLGTVSAAALEETSQDNEPPAPRAAQMAPLRSDLTGGEPRPAPPEPDLPPVPLNNGLAESVAALDETEPPTQHPDAAATDEEPAGERLEVLDRLVSRMEALETNLRDEIAKNQDLERQISDLKSDEASGLEAEPELPSEVLELADDDAVSRQPQRRAAVEDAPAPSKPAPEQDRPELEPEPEDAAPAPRQKAKAKTPELPDVEVDDLDTDFELEVELDEDYDDDLAPGNVASADWLNVAAETDASGRNYFLRHWAGELSLGKAVWANAIPLFLILAAIPYGLSFIDLGAESTKLIVAAAILSVAVPALVWIAVGVWRAAENHRAWHGGFVWPSLAQTWVLFSFVVFGGIFAATLLPDQVSKLFSLKLDLEKITGGSEIAGTKTDDNQSDRLPGARSFDRDTAQPNNRLAEQQRLAGQTTDGVATPNQARVNEDGLRAQVAGLRAKSQKSLVQVISFNANKIPTSVGMGFYVREDLVATTYHTVQDAHALSLQNVGDKDITFSARVKAYSVELDLALIETTRKSTPIPLNSQNVPNVGDGVVVLGNPRWEASSATTGSIRTAEATDDGVLYVSTALVSPGSSGGPVFDQSGQLLGLARFAVQGAKPVTYIMPASLIAAVEKRDMSQVKETPGRQVNDSIRGTLKLTNYVKAAGSETEIISIKNETRHSLENIFFAVLYKGKGGDILYGRSLQMRGPLQPGAEESMTVRVPDLLKSYAAKSGDGSGPTMSIELIPLDYLPSDFSG